MTRDFDANPYSADEQRVADFLFARKHLGLYPCEFEVVEWTGATAERGET